MAQSPIESEPSLGITRHYPVAPEKAWWAWTDPQALSRWFKGFLASPEQSGYS